MSGTYIDSEHLVELANKLKSKGNEILNQDKENCVSALEMSNNCLQMSGLDTSEFAKLMDQIYSNVNERISGLADFLVNTVVPEYDTTAKAIGSSFNDGFANSIAGILGPTAAKFGVAGGVAGGAASLLTGKLKNDAIKTSGASVYKKNISNCGSRTIMTSRGSRTILTSGGGRTVMTSGGGRTITTSGGNKIITKSNGQNIIKTSNGYRTVSGSGMVVGGLGSASVI